MDIKIYSDAACTWSFGEEKILRAIDYIYLGKVKFTNVMGGLFSDYRDLLPINMKDQDSTEMANKILFEMWKTGENFHHMPMMKKAPELLSEEKSSVYPIDIGFVAARLTDEKRANEYLRALREATILYGRNTMEKEVQIEIAEELGFDLESYKDNLYNYANEEFLEDRMDAFDHRFTLFPNFIYKNSENREVLAKGYKNLKDLMTFIDENETLEKRTIITDKENVFDFIKEYKKVFKVEILEIFEKDKIDDILKNLEEENKVEIYEVGTGIEIKVL